MRDYPNVRRGWHRISRPNPPVGYYHYSNPRSQNSLICETAGFPDAYDPKTQEFHEGYSDRIQQWDRARFDLACKIVGTGEQGWAYRLPAIGDSKLKEFAKVALNIPEDQTVLHVRAVHHFNVATGYSCPVVMAIFEKK